MSIIYLSILFLTLACVIVTLDREELGLSIDFKLNGHDMLSYDLPRMYIFFASYV